MTEFNEETFLKHLLKLIRRLNEPEVSDTLVGQIEGYLMGGLEFFEAVKKLEK